MGNATWQPPASAGPYLPLIYSAEQHYGMPHNLLARLLYQESRYREDIISGRTVSSAGAVGIAQLVPRFFPDIDARDPRQAIPAAARYLARLCRQFGSWALALAAYNWGPGNLSTRGVGNAPGETVAYLRQISADVPGVTLPESLA